MSDQKPRSLPAPLDGRAIFERASSPAGLTVGWQRVRDNAGSAGGDGQTIESFAANAGERIAALSTALATAAIGRGRCALPSSTSRAAASAS